jgi:hypothetical protein
MNVCGNDVKVQGRFVRIGSVAAEGFEYLENSEETLRQLQKSGSGMDLFTFMQPLPRTTPEYRFPMELDNLAVLPISTFDHWWNKQIDGKTRNMVRRAEKKGVVVREVPFDDALVTGIWEIYNECPVRQGRNFPHYGKDIEAVRKMSATFPDSSVFIGAYLEEKLIGFMKLTADKARTQTAVMHILGMIQHRDKAPTNALIAQAVRSCEKHGYPYLVYSKFAFAKMERDSLSDFKESNGFQRIDLPRYYVPLTALGRIALPLGLHHRLADRVPASVRAKLREFRSAWLNRKAQRQVRDHGQAPA